jgi:Zn-dependent peptidase ImmA (M78 family)/transcriptional regulator with XRE-family HTH domain
MKTGVPGFQGIRLRQAREAMGLSITSLADLIGVSKQAISQFERGSDAPSQPIFDRIRTTLRHESQFFLKRPASLTPGTCFFRSMAATTKSARVKAEVWQLWVRELISYCLTFVEFPPLNFPPFDDIPIDPNFLSMETIEAIAEDLRDYWNCGDGPIPNLIETVEGNGTIVVRHDLSAETLDALSVWFEPEGFPLVVLNSDKNVYVRSRMDLAHEIGHLVLHRHVEPDQLKHSDTFRLLEDQAFRFGGALLLPEHSFLEDLYSLSLDGLLSVKLKWKVSVALMIQRLQDLNIVSQDQFRRLRINYSARKWTKTEPYDDEMPTEQPLFMSGVVKLLVNDGIQSLDQIVANTGFSREWVQRLLSLPHSDIDPRPKILEFKRRA